MRKALKIGLIALAVVGIGALIWLSLTYHDNDIKKVTFNDSYFTAQIKARAEKEIGNGTSFPAIMRSYNTMAQQVGDAAYLENINARETRNCRQLLVYNYAPKLTEHARQCFESHVWNASHLDTLREEARNLIAADLLPSDSRDLPRLHDIVKTVDDYHKAVEATHVGGTFTSVKAAKNVIARASSFKRSPLSNCTSLVEAINAVPGKVKTSLLNYIVAACNRHKPNIDALLRLIDDYEHEFGSNSQLKKERDKLREAKYRADGYNKEKQMH